jgi:hypothetical protein
LINPRHSRPLDVHRWSDHPEIKSITDTVWGLPSFEEWRVAARAGPKPLRRFKEQLRVLLTDLYVCWRTDPTESLGLGMSPGRWKANSRYNQLHLSPILPRLVHALQDEGLILFSRGSYAGPGEPGNRTSRIMASEALIALFGGEGPNLIELEPPRQQELVILRNDTNDDIAYEDTDRTRQWRGHLEAYNELLWNTFIDCPGLQNPYVEKAIEEGPKAGITQKFAVGGRNFAVRRIFSRGRWDRNGRLYGGWWQLVPKAYRTQSIRPV